jgi:hypothetical protein
MAMDAHTALALQVTTAFGRIGIKGTLTQERKSGLRKALDKKCSNEKA